MIPESPLPLSLLFKHSSLEGPNFIIPRSGYITVSSICLKKSSPEYSPWFLPILTDYGRDLKWSISTLDVGIQLSCIVLVVNPFSIDVSFASHPLLLAVVWGSEWLSPYNVNTHQDLTSSPLFVWCYFLYVKLNFTICVTLYTRFDRSLSMVPYLLMHSLHQSFYARGKLV